MNAAGSERGLLLDLLDNAWSAALPDSDVAGLATELRAWAADKPTVSVEPATDWAEHPQDRYVLVRMPWRAAENGAHAEILERAAARGLFTLGPISEDAEPRAPGASGRRLRLHEVPLRPTIDIIAWRLLPGVKKYDAYRAFTQGDFSGLEDTDDVLAFRHDLAERRRPWADAIYPRTEGSERRKYVEVRMPYIEGYARMNTSLLASLAKTHRLTLFDAGDSLTDRDMDRHVQAQSDLATRLGLNPKLGSHWKPVY